MKISLKTKIPWPKWLASLLIILFTCIAYLPALNGDFVWDDDYNFVNNPLMTDEDGLMGIWTSEEAFYYPLVLTTFWIERQLWGLNHVGYHLVNVAFHAINAILLWLLLRRFGINGSWFAGAIFALHPVHVESVAWITELKNVQSGFFFLLVLLSYLNFEEKQKKLWYVMALLMFVMALLSKTSTVMLPVVLLLYRWWSGKSLKWRDIGMTVPFFVLSALASGWTVWEQQYHSGAIGSEWSAGLPERIAIAGRVVWFYLVKLMVPYKLIFFYPRWSIDPGFISSYIPTMALIILFVVFWCYRHGWGSPMLMGWGFFVVNLFPVMGFFNVFFMRYSFVSDHFQYLASMGMIALGVGCAVWGLEQLDLKQVGGISRWYRVGVGFGLIILLVLGILTWRHGYIFKNEEALWQDAINKNPQAWMAHNNLGHIYFDQGKVEDAIKEYKMALKIRPNYANAHTNLGLIYFNQGKLEDALKEHQIALKFNPNSSNIHNNLGLVYLNQGKIFDAIREYQIALKIQPKNASAHNNLGVAYIKNRLVDKAIEEYRMALKLNPDYLDAYNNLGNAYKAKGLFDEAIEEYSNALKLDPNNPSTHYNLGLVYLEKGLINDSIEKHRKAITLKPGYFEAVYNLARMLDDTGDKKGALSYYKRFLEIAPQSPASKPFIDKAKERISQP